MGTEGGTYVASFDILLRRCCESLLWMVLLEESQLFSSWGDIALVLIGSASLKASAWVDLMPAEANPTTSYYSTWACTQREY